MFLKDFYPRVPRKPTCMLSGCPPEVKTHTFRPAYDLPPFPSALSLLDGFTFVTRCVLGYWWLKVTPTPLGNVSLIAWDRESVELHHGHPLKHAPR